MEGDLIRHLTQQEKEAIRKRAEKSIGHKVHDKKISKIKLFTRCRSYLSSEIQVGKFLDKEISGPSNEEVGAIFKAEDGFYVVCTPSHGIEKGEPFIFRDQEIYAIEEEA